MKIDRQISSITYDVKLEFHNAEKQILRNALEILKGVSNALDASFIDPTVSSSTVEKDVNDLILEIDKYTDYICKR